MARSIVVGYGTKRGSTREVAEAVGAVLSEHGFAVELLPAQDVGDVGRYDGVVLGAALYTGRLQRDARRFLKRHRKELATLPVAVFALGPRQDTKEHLQRSRQQLERALAKVPEVKPVLTGCFGGADREKQVDLRDWAVIRAWAEDAADAFDAALLTRVEGSTES